MSSLEKQLKRLRIPENTSLERATKFKKKTSFLFDPKEASDIDNETVFALALNGLDELKLVNEHFRIFEDTLFNESSKHLERSLQTQEVNDRLDAEIRSYLQFVSPYILLKPSHKTLEWLIRRFQIQVYNVDDLLACVFPYHQSNVFARVVQLLNITNTKWSWLSSVQKTGSPLPRSNIIQHCLSNPGFLTFISSLAFSVVKGKTKVGQSSAAIRVFSSFYASTIIGVLESLEKVSEEIVGSLLIHIIHGLKSDVNDLQAASYMIIGQLSTKCTLKSTVVESLLKTMCKNVTAPLSESLIMCINCLCSAYDLTEFPKKAFLSLCKLPNLATLLGDLSKSYQLDSFLKVFTCQLIETVLKSLIGDDGSDKEAHSSLLLDLLKDVNVHESLKVDFTRNMLIGYIKMRRVCGDVDNAQKKLDDGLKNAMRIIQNRWQPQMDKTVQDYLVSLQKSETSKKENERILQWTQDFVSMALSNAGSQVVRESGSTLILALHHPEAEFRKLALKKVSSILKQPVDKMEDKEFLKESLLLKLDDEDPAVVLTVLKLNEGLINICHGEQLVTSLIKLLEKCSSAWTKVFEKALAILLSDELLEKKSCSSDHILFHLIPLMFLTKNHVSRAKLIVDQLSKSQLTSEWLLKSLQKKTLRKVFEKCSEDSTCQELAVANGIFICSLAKNIALLENELAFKMIGKMQEHANGGHNQTFVVVYLMAGVQLLNETKDDALKFDIISTFLHNLLPLVNQVAQAQGKSKPLKELDDASVEARRDCGILPINLIANYIYMLKRNSDKKLERVVSRIYLFLMEHMIKFLPVYQNHSSAWWTFSDGNNHEKQYTKILLSVFEVLLYGLGKGQYFPYQDQFQNCLETVIKVQFPKKEHLLKIFTFLWSNGTRGRTREGFGGIPVPSALAVIQSLHIAQMLIKSFDKKAMVDIVSDHSQVIPSLIVSLTSPVMAVRQTVLQTMSLIVSRSAVKTAAVVLCTVLCESSEEISADESFIISVFQRYLSSVHNSPDTSKRRKSKSKKSPVEISTDNVLEYILKHVVNQDTPSHVVRVILAVLAKVDTKSCLLRCLPLMKLIINKHLKNQDCSWDQSQIVLYIIQKFTPQSVSVLKTEPELLEMFLQLLSLSKPLFSDHMTLQKAILNQMSAEFFEAIPDEHIHSEIFGKLIDVLMETSDPKMSAKLKEVLKLIPISADQIDTELTKLADKDKGKSRKTKKAKAVISEDWSLSLGPFWQRVVVIIEMLQTKDNISHPETLLPTLFKILSMCLEISEQTSSDYLRQLVLSTILKICQAHIDQGNVLTRGVFSEEHFSVEQIIHCIRVSGNPQTHHHALCLLAIAAQLFPEKVLHNIMSIFTFMGVNVLRQDDTYSFQVIERTVEAVIPALIQAEKNKQNIQTLVTKVLRVFVDAFPHVPEHRRVPIFVHLLATVGTASYLHVCLALLLEKLTNKETKEEALGNTKETGIVFCRSLCSMFSPDAQMTCLNYLLKYLSSLPEEKPEGYNRKRHADTSGIIFDVNSHSGEELHQFKLGGIDVILNVLGSEKLTEMITHLSAEKRENMDHFYLSLLEESLKYVKILSKLIEGSNKETTTKYLRAMLHKVYDVVQKVSELLPGPTFVNIVSQLVHNKNSAIRKKAMELFNKRMAGRSKSSEKETETTLVLLDAVIKLTQNDDEVAVNKQSAFHTIIVLSRLLGDTQFTALKKVFAIAITTFSNQETKVQVASSALLCLAELISVLKVHTIPFLSKFLPSVLNIVEINENEARSDLLLLGALTVIHKVIQTLPNFVSPYLRNILTQLMSSSFVKLDESGTDENSSWKKQIVERAANMRADIAVLVKPRILIPNLSQCYDDIVQNENYESIIILFQLLGECVVSMTKEDVKNYNHELLSLFMSALDYRSQHGQGISEDCLLKTEEGIIDAFLALIMRLSESLFRPMFLKLVNWATRSSSTKSRLLVFYHLADRMAEKLKGLFVLFAGYIIKNAASVLDANNILKTEEMFFANDESNVGDEEKAVEKSCQLLRYVLDCLQKCFLYDNQRFVNKERFDCLLQPLVDQIENQTGDSEVFHDRVTHHLAPCLAQFAVAAGDESYWKSIIHHVCLKTRSSSSQVRLAALKVIQELNSKLGEEYLALLPEIIPFLAELMEDESFEVEQQCQQLISEMENVLGESLQKYF